MKTGGGEGARRRETDENEGLETLGMRGVGETKSDGRELGERVPGTPESC